MTSTSCEVETILPGMNVFLGPAHLADVHQAFDARLEFDERAVVGDVRDPAGVLRARRILGSDTVPRIGFELLHTQADTLGLAVEADNLDVDGLADLQRLARVIDTTPRNVGDMQQAIDAAEVHERAVISDVLDDAVEDHAFLEALDQLAALLGTGLFEDGTARDHDIAARAVHLENLERLRRAHQRADVANRADIDLAARQERDGAAEIDGEAALDPAVDGAVDALLRFERTLEAGPRLFAAGLLARQDDGAVAVFVTLDIELDVVAGLDLGLLTGEAELLKRNAPFTL